MPNSNKILSQQFYKITKNTLKQYKSKFGESFARLNANGRIIPGKQKEKGSQLYFINIDKLLNLSFHDVKFLIETVLVLAKKELNNNEIERVNLCGLYFEKVHPTNRGKAMLELKAKQENKENSPKPFTKMKVGIKSKSLIQIKQGQ